MATNMAPHNLGEVIAAARHLIRHPDASLDALMRFVPGPDLPTGGKIVGLEGVRDAYESGRGIFRTRATCRIEQITPRRTGIVVTELPYGVGPEKVIARIKDLVQSKKLTGITDVKDLTDRHRGLQLVIEIRSGFHPEAVLTELYRLTPMEETFGINNVALVDGQPRVLGLRELLSIYVDHRIEVVRRRSEFRRRKREDRLHLVDGLMIALLDIDEVIGVIRSSDDSAAAKQRLMAVFDLSEIQAQYILDTPLRRLTRFDRLELERERETLRREIAELTEILSSEDRLRSVVSAELADIAKRFGTPRRTVLLEGNGAALTAAVPLEVADDPCTVLLSSTGLLARTAPGVRRAGRDRSATEAARRAARGARRDRVHRAGHGPRNGRRGDVGRADDQAQRAGVPGAAAERAVPRAVGRHPDRGVRVAGARRDRGGAGVAGHGSGRAGARHRVGRGQARPAGLPAGPGRVRGHHAEGGRPGRRGGSAAPASRRTWSSSAATASCCASRPRRSGRRDASPGGWPGSGCRRVPRSSGSGRSTRRGLCRVWRLLWAGWLMGLAVLAGRRPVVVTVAGSAGALPGTAAGSVKVSPYAEFPAKGRATGGVRCHRFLKGEDALILAWAGPSPALGATEAGGPVDLPGAFGRRDGSGVGLAQPLAAVGGALPDAPGTPEATSAGPTARPLPLTRPSDSGSISQ